VEDTRQKQKPSLQAGGSVFRSRTPGGWESVETRSFFWQNPERVLLKRFVGYVGIVLGTFQGKYPGKSNLKQTLFKKKRHLCTRKSFMGRPCFLFCKVFWEEIWKFVQMVRICLYQTELFAGVVDEAQKRLSF